MNIAVLLPCYNEATAIGEVVASFRRALPEADIFVFDNASSDQTARIAREAGAAVRFVGEPGKGSVVRRMFADIDADIYLLADGDGTYDAASAPAMIDALRLNCADMVVGRRIAAATASYRTGHRWGNRLLTAVAARIFGTCTSDMLSGYRIFSRRFVKSFPAASKGFEIETELTVHGLQLRMPIVEVDTPYYARAADSVSKLQTYPDGFRILRTILRMFKAEKPFLFYAICFLACAIASIILAIPVVVTYAETGLVPRLPTAVLSAALMLLGTIFLSCGLILETVTLGRIEMKRAAYLAHPAPPPP